MLFYPQEKIAIFVDGANLYGAAKGLQFDIDYKRLLELFARKGLLVRAFYYTALAEEQEFSPLRPLIDWLDYNGFTVVTKPLKEYTDAQGRRRVKGNMDIELAIDVMEMSERIDHVVIFSGDGDFRKLVEAVQRRGKRVSVCSTIRTQPPMVADELRRQADNFIELEELKLDAFPFGKAAPGRHQKKSGVGFRREDAVPSQWLGGLDCYIRSPSRPHSGGKTGRHFPIFTTIPLRVSGHWTRNF